MNVLRTNIKSQRHLEAASRPRRMLESMLARGNDKFERLMDAAFDLGELGQDTITDAKINTLQEQMHKGII